MRKLYLNVENDDLEDLPKYINKKRITIVDSKQESDFILRTSEDSSLKCSLPELAEFLEWSLHRDNFDSICLDDFDSLAVVHRTVSSGSPNLLVKPALFEKLKTADITEVSNIKSSPVVSRNVVYSKQGNLQKNSKQIVTYTKDTGLSEIYKSALVFFLLIFSGVILYFAYKKTRKQRR